MLATPQGSIRLFRFAGVQVFLHWSWFLIAVYDISLRRGLYTTLGWNVVEVLTFFGIVLLHEMGHALACRQVGGTADTIVLWPLGGLAYVNPPQRAGAQLWSIVAGPLVNVVLAVIFLALGQPDIAGVGFGSEGLQDWLHTHRDFHQFLLSVSISNLVLLVFNLLPIYPLDGGQILRSLLWFVVGRSRSLVIAAGIGFVGTAGLAALAIYERSLWLGILTFFLFQQCLRGMQYARALRKLEQLPQHKSFICPTCHISPPAARVYGCERCRASIDPFESGGICPNCGNEVRHIPCVHCGTIHSTAEWGLAPPPVPRSEERS